VPQVRARTLGANLGLSHWIHTVLHIHKLAYPYTDSSRPCPVLFNSPERYTQPLCRPALQLDLIPFVATVPQSLP